MFQAGKFEYLNVTLNAKKLAGQCWYLLVVRASRVAGNASSQRIQDYQRGVEAAAVVGVEHPHARERKYEDGQGRKLRPDKSGRSINRLLMHIETQDWQVKSALPAHVIRKNEDRLCSALYGGERPHADAIMQMEDPASSKQLMQVSRAGTLTADV
jgi:hypothetical protein